MWPLLERRTVANLKGTIENWLRLKDNCTYLGNDSYFESIYFESEVQDFSDSDQAIISDTPNLAGMGSESKAEPNTFASHESPLKISKEWPMSCATI